MVEDPVNGARAVMDGFMTPFNAEDADAIRSRWFHFPPTRLFHSRYKEQLRWIGQAMFPAFQGRTRADSR
jgi:hypothetical protein